MEGMGCGLHQKEVASSSSLERRVVAETGNERGKEESGGGNGLAPWGTGVFCYASTLLREMEEDEEELLIGGKLTPAPKLIDYGADSADNEWDEVRHLRA